MSVWNICTASRMPRLCDLKAKIHLKTECKNAISLILVNQYSWTCATLTKARKSTETSLESTIRWRDLFSLLYGHALLLKKKKTVKLCSIWLLYSGRHYILLHPCRVSHWVIHWIPLGGSVLCRRYEMINGWK